MGIKAVVVEVEVTPTEKATGKVTSRRVREIIGYTNPDSVRQAANRGRIRRVDGERGMYWLSSVLSHRDWLRGRGWRGGATGGRRTRTLTAA